MKMSILHACEQIRLDRLYYLTQRQLVAANDESIRLGMPRNLIERKAARLPAHFKFPIVSAWHHRSGEGQTNIRLELIVGKNAKDKHYCTLDVPYDTWVRLKKNPVLDRHQQQVRCAGR
jgi:hypothetical protein